MSAAATAKHRGSYCDLAVVMATRQRLPPLRRCYRTVEKYFLQTWEKFFYRENFRRSNGSPRRAVGNEAKQVRAARARLATRDESRGRLVI